MTEMSAPNDILALLASIRPRPSPGNNTPGQDPATLPQYPAPGLQHQQQQQLPYLQQPPPYDGQSLPHPQFHQQHPQQQAYHHPSVTTVYTPSPVNNTPPHNGLDVISPSGTTPRGEWQQPPLVQPQPNQDSAASLLNLLKFNQPTQPPQQPQQPQQQAPAAPVNRLQPSSGQETGSGQAASAHERSISASDFVASLLGKPEPSPAAPTEPTAGLQRHPSERPSSGRATPAAPAAPLENTQDMLLRLLNRSKPAQDRMGEQAAPQQTPPVTSSPKPNLEAQESLPPRADSRASAPGVGKNARSAQQSPSKDSMFTYVNPFDQLAAVSLPNKAPQPSKSRSASPAVGSAKGKRSSVSPAVTSKPPVAPEATAESQVPNAKEPKGNVPDVAHQGSDQADNGADKTADKAPREATAPVAAAENDASKPVLSSVESQAHDAASGAEKEKKNLDEEGPKKTTKEAAPVVKTEVAKETTVGRSETVLDSWENAEDKAAKEEERVVPVYNFPIRPFITITVHPNTGKIPSLRDDGIMDIARLKKEFDQLDRSLTSASTEYIVYALAKNGGMRIIRQDDGSDKQVFRSTRDRVFNVALCTSPQVAGVTREQAILGIGVSGTVYWAMISRPEKDLFELDALESESLTFPPFPASDENTSGGQLKTRAKRSARHPEFFAIGRGKNIYVVSPKAAMDYTVSGSQRTVNTEKFFQERALKISTGKAGKDFVFSEDDTVVASLDKTGRLRFWDIRDVLNNLETFTNTGGGQSEVRVPLNTFVTGSPTEKSWPTSVQFVDKLRPHSKAMAVRYVLVGLKQNHTLQLWDIGLGRAVEEIRFPHENESDAICSVAYHPGSSIIVVGHPTRNSIYFVHLSAPRYNLQPMSQASFVKRASERDSELPRPESTACMSGIREISFASKGELRSLDLLPISKTASDKRGVDEENGLFELYVMHSRGVTCLNIKKEDLGWNTEFRSIRPVNALEEGFINIVDLQTFPSYVSEEPSVNGDAASTPSKGAAKELPKKLTETPAAETSAPRNVSPPKPLLKKKTGEEQAETTTNGVTEKQDKKKKKKSAAAAGESAAKVKETDVSTTEPATTSEVAPGPRPTPQATKLLSKEQPDSSDIPDKQQPTTMAAPSTEKSSTPIAAADLSKHLEGFQNSVFSEFNKSLGREFEGLSRRFDDERRAWDAATADKQDQVLRVVSSTLSDNVEKNLTRIVTNSVQSEVVPSISKVASDAVGKQLNEAISKQVGGILPRELRQVLPDVVARAVQQPETMKGVSDAVAQKLASQVQGEVSKSLHSTIAPALKDATVRATERVGNNLDKQVQGQLQRYETQRRSDSAKIDQLTSLVHGLSDTVSSMAAAQTSFQNEILRLNRLVAQNTEEKQRQLVPSGVVQPQKTAEQVELEEIAQLMNDGRYEEGSVKVSTYNFHLCFVENTVFY